MQTGPNNCYILYYLIDTLKYLTKGNNSRICIDGTLWSQCKPVYKQLIILLCSVEIEAGKSIQIPVCMAFMSSKTHIAYAQIFDAINSLLMTHYNTTMDSPLITTDAGGALRSAVKSTFSTRHDVGPTGIEYLTCGFHQNANLKDHFMSSMKSELSSKNECFNKTVLAYYLVCLKLYYLPVGTVLLLMNYLIRKLDTDLFHDNLDEHSLVKQKLHKVLSYIKNRYEKEGNLLSWNTYIMANRDMEFIDSTSNKIGNTVILIIFILTNTK